jgi:hypothetical protein
MKAQTYRTIKPYNRRKHGRCMGRYIIKPRKHMTDRMIRRKWGSKRSLRRRIKERRDYRVRGEMFKLYAYVTSGY